jgi:pyruvate/2-oxoglutarate/acetoin dehydrogenase E1 component
MGGRRGYGPTHSQSLETLFLGVPGLTIAAISHLGNPGEVLRASVEDVDGPVLLVENKLLYTRPAVDESDLARAGLHATVGGGLLPSWTLSHDGEPDLTLVTYGGMTPLVMDAASELRANDDLSCQIVVAHQLAPLEMAPMLASLLRTRRLVIVEEGVGDWGWGAEIVAKMANVRLDAPPQRVAAKASPIPASRRLEDDVLPQTAHIVQAALRTVDETFV